MADVQKISFEDVPAIIESGAMDDRSYLKAASFLRDEGFWKSWALRALFALAIGHIFSGIIFFFAFNWNDLAPMLKFAVVGGGIFACLAAWMIARLDSPMGQAFGIGATVLVGVMFAVLGQVYQTPAMIHTPFVFWALLTLPFALASRNLAHWTVWLVILTVAISSYANSGLRLAGHDLMANVLNIAVAGGTAVGLVMLDKVLAPRLKWARGEWFRVLLVLGAAGFALFGFTESFWDRGSNGLWILALGVMGALLAYLYKFKPSLATLSLGCFGVFLMVAQFGFKLFDGFGFDWGLGLFFVAFIWLGALTVGLVAIFRHIVRRFKEVESSAATEGNPAPSAEISMTSFANHMELDASRLSAVLSSEDERDPPWYMSAFLAVAGVLTAVLGCLFFGSIIALTVSFDNPLSYGVLGAVIFIGAVVIRRLASSPYPKHIMNTMIIIGGLMTVFGIGFHVEQFDTVVALVLFLAAIVLAFIKDPILEFLAAITLIAAIGSELYHLNLPFAESLILSISTALGVFLISRPIGSRVFKSAGTAFLMAPALLGIALVHAQRWDNLLDASRFSDDLLARVISLVVLLVGVAFLNRGKALGEFKPPILILIPLVIGAALIPLGGASALLLILTGYILGSKSLAMIGTLLQIYFLTMFYYDLSLDLLTKSIILFVSGLVFLGVWIVVRRRKGMEVLP